MIPLYSADSGSSIPALYGVAPTNPLPPEAQAAAFAASGCTAVYALRPLGNLGDRPVADNIVGIPSTFEFWYQFAAALPAAPELVVMDAEYHWDGFYAAPFIFDNPEIRQSVLNDQRIRAVLPPQLQGMTEQNANIHYPAWWEWAARRYHAVLRRNVRAAFAAVFTRDVPVINYMDVQSDSEVREHNDWALPQSTVAGIASPSLYLYDLGWRYQSVRGRVTGKKDRRWYRYVDLVNTVYACCNAGPCISWHAARSADTDHSWGIDPGIQYLCNELVQHACFAGVDGMILQQDRKNPQYQADADAMLATVKRYGATARKKIQRLPWSLEADEVRTGSCTTSYKTFLKYAA